MIKTINFSLAGVRSVNDKMKIETEVDVLDGVLNINVLHPGGKTSVEFNDELISAKEVFSAINKLGYGAGAATAETEPAKNDQAINEHAYYVKGMHCASCEILIEKKLLAVKGVKSVEADAAKGEVLIEYAGQKPSAEKLNNLFKKDHYQFFDRPVKSGERRGSSKKNELLIILGAAILFIIGFLSLNKLGLAGLVNINSNSSLLALFIFGLLAGLSSCAALVGGMVLSMSKQWQDLYSGQETALQKFQPHLLFNAGRIASYAILGAVLGLIGGQLQISARFTALLVIGISVMMFCLALQMLGVKAFRKFQFGLPKFATRYIADENNFKGRWMPSIMGALTFFLPCGFTITAQGLALVSGSPVQGGLIMLFFALGTAPMLLLIGLSSVKFFSQPHLALRFSKIAGLLVLFFALFNINNQLNVLGFTSLNDISAKGAPVDAADGQIDTANLVNGKQVIKMQAAASGYSPNYFKVKAGLPVRWEITDVGTSGCTNAVISNSLFSGQIDLRPGQTSIKEFTPAKAGKYKFSCWMGMISGIIEVVNQGQDTSAVPAAAVGALADTAVIPSGAKGCGCGGGGSGSCSAR